MSRRRDKHRIKIRTNNKLVKNRSFRITHITSYYIDTDIASNGDVDISYESSIDTVRNQLIRDEGNDNYRI